MLRHQLGNFYKNNNAIKKSLGLAICRECSSRNETSMRKFSIIIPTLNRSADLRRLLDSVFQQSLLPFEVIVIDQSSNDETSQLIAELEPMGLSLGFSLVFRHLPEPGLTRARNVGLTCGTGDYAIFLDDDVVLDSDYLKAIDDTITRHGAIVVQGKITNYYERYDPIKYVFMRIFQLSSPSQTRGVVYPSFGNVLPVRFDEETPCMWASGCNHAIKIDVALALQYDEKLISYALGEDVDMTFRAYLQFPGAVWATPYARLVHLESTNQRIGDRRFIFMEAVHRRYLFCKHTASSDIAKLQFAWSRLGVLILCCMRFIQKPKQFRVNLANLRYTLSAEIYSVRHRQEIVKGDLGFFHAWFKEIS